MGRRLRLQSASETGNGAPDPHIAGPDPQNRGPGFHAGGSARSVRRAGGAADRGDRVAGIGIGIALQGVLRNVMAGLSIIFTKPFRVGDYIDIVGVYGQVTTIDIFSTTLMHADLSKVVIPNHKIVGEILHNYGRMRQLNLTVGVGYGTNLPEALGIVNDVLFKSPHVLKEPAATMGITQLADSSIQISMGPWVKVKTSARRRESFTKPWWSASKRGTSRSPSRSARYV